jgi:hypothetical protein
MIASIKPLVSKPETIPSTFTDISKPLSTKHQEPERRGHFQAAAKLYLTDRIS